MSEIDKRIQDMFWDMFIKETEHAIKVQKIMKKSLKTKGKGDKLTFGQFIKRYGKEKL